MVYKPQGLTRRETSRGLQLLIGAVCMVALFLWLDGGNWAPPASHPELVIRLVHKIALPAVISEASLRGNLGPKGTYSRKRYLFRNVWLREEDTIAAFLPLGQPLPKPLVANAFNNNASTPQPPTTFTIAMTPAVHVKINVDYRTASALPGGQPDCKRWEDRPTFLMFTPHHKNVWHVLTDALIASFQTLREEGLVPLARVDDDLNVQEYISGLERDECHPVFVIGNNTARRPERCRPQTGRVPSGRCDPATESWCRPGLVAVNRTNGPILLLPKGSVQPSEKWRHLFMALSEDIREWEDEVGTCFRELYVGKSTTLNFYVPTNGDSVETNQVRRFRRHALLTAQELLLTAEAHHDADVLKEDPDAAPWPGYSNEGLERLRRGVGPEDIKALNTLRSLRFKAIEENIEENAAKEMVRRLITAHRGVADVVAARAQGQHGDTHPIMPMDAYMATQIRELTRTRPIVTFMWRAELSRCALNEADLLEYVLRRYNVTVRVTTFAEPAMEMMALMNGTDVVIGMHGAGWTNTLFLKPGAAGLQLLPYGWLLDEEANFNMVRGGAYRSIVLMLGGPYAAWVNPHADHAFIRKGDWEKAVKNQKASYDYATHPEKHWVMPMDESPGDHWIYQNTLLDVADVAPAVDALMAMRGIEPMDKPLLD